MKYEWSRRKSDLNRAKHGIRFADAIPAIEDEWAVTIAEQSVAGELRFLTVGTDALNRLIVVVYTWRGESIRIISARPATRRERRAYEEGI